MNNRDAKIVIDPGHGGTDGGASGNGIIEKDLTLAISNYMYNRFRELGIPVVLTRNSDETLTPSERTTRSKNAFGANKDVILISNHINAGGGDGAEVIYALRNNDVLANKILDEIKKEGQNVRYAFQRRLPSDTSKDYYFILRDTNPLESVIVEYGFLDSSGDDPNQLKNNYRIYAEAVVRAVTDYLGINYTPVPGSGYYTVQSGDSLWGIAKKFNISVDLLKSANNLTSNSLKIGQLLKIPSSEEIPSTGDFITYIVRSGDNLYKIANNYETTVQELMTYNNLNSTNLSIGQQLLIPKDNIPGDETIYVVQSGDNLYKIANLYNTTVSEILSYNNLTNTNLSVGQQIKIPQTNNQLETNEISYTVKSGDSLWSIARKYNTTPSELMTYNNLKTNLLSIGQVLRIPSTNSSNDNTYIVKSGDSLWSIANRYNTTVDAIKAKNNLTSNNLSIGQVLTI